MTAAFIDTNILIELYRSNSAAKAWYAAQSDLAVASVTWLEFMEGARGKAGQGACLRILMSVEVVMLTEADQQWAMSQLLKFRLSHGVSFKDCLIASVCHRLQFPLYTKNVKDFVSILGASLVVKPY